MLFCAAVLAADEGIVVAFATVLSAAGENDVAVSVWGTVAGALVGG